MQQRGTSDSQHGTTVAQAALFAVIIALFWGVDTLSKRNIRMIDGIGPDDFRLFAEQGTSAFAVWLLIPFVAWMLRRNPLSREPLWRSIIAHVIGSAVFALAHYWLMIGMRMIIYPFFGESYHLSSFWFSNLLIEWQKDLKVYAAAIGILIAFDFVQRQRLQASRGDDRLVAQSGTGQHLVAYDDIEYFESSRNYVSVHTREREYLLRRTVASLEEELKPRQFLRAHRRFLVNQKSVQGIESGSNGPELILASGQRVPLSRSRRDDVKALLGL